jgi:putative sterol carrier protein
MTYDPKKTRTKQKAAESVVDEIFEDEAKTSIKKASSSQKSVKKEISETEDAKVIDIKDLQEQKASEMNNNTEAPLVMQPQVWVALAASAIVALLILKKRRK